MAALVGCSQEQFVFRDLIGRKAHGHDACGNSGYDAVRGHVFGYDGPGGYYGARSDRHARDNYCSETDPNIILNDGLAAVAAR
jgi:hypothetical protein